MTHSNSDTVVLVEDDELVSSTLVAVLTSRGFSVVACNSAEYFIEHFSSIDTKCLILDVELGDGRLNGIDLLRWIRGKNWPLPVILLSGKASVSQIVDALRETVVDIITKPPSVPRLINAVEMSLSLQIEAGKKPNATALRTVLNSLSNIERSILEMLLAGSSNKLIASKLDMGLRSAVRYRKSLLESFGFESIPELANALGAAGINLSEYAFPNPLRPNNASLSLEVHERICDLAQRLAGVDRRGASDQLQKSLESCQAELQKIAGISQYTSLTSPHQLIQVNWIGEDVQLAMLTKEFLALHGITVELSNSLAAARPMLSSVGKAPFIVVESPGIRKNEFLQILSTVDPQDLGLVIWIGNSRCSNNTHCIESIAKPYSAAQLVQLLHRINLDTEIN